MAECNIARNKKDCTCTYEPCPRKGRCCDCLQYHWKTGGLPACLFPKDVEAGYDRSVENFIETYQKRGKWW